MIKKLANFRKRFYTSSEDYVWENQMISKSFFITCVGMGGVFLFLSLMVFVMELMRVIVTRTEKKKVSDKIAAVIAIIQNQES